MSDTSSYLSISNDKITGYKNETGYTPVDYRDFFALKAEQIDQFCKLSSDIEDYNDFTRVSICLITISIKFKRKQERIDNSNESISFHSNSDSDLSIDIELISFLDSTSDSCKTSPNTSEDSATTMSSIDTTFFMVMRN